MLASESEQSLPPLHPRRNPMSVLLTPPGYISNEAGEPKYVIPDARDDQGWWYYSMEGSALQSSPLHNSSEVDYYTTGTKIVKTDA